MTITSVVVSTTKQADGLVSVHERHTDDVTGQIVDRVYITDVMEDISASMMNYASAIDESIKHRDMSEAVFGPSWNYVLTHASREQLNAYVRELYRTSSGEMLAAVAKRVIEWVDNGLVTDAEAQAVTGMDSAQWGVMVAKMRYLVQAYMTINSAVGE